MGVLNSDIAISQFALNRFKEWEVAHSKEDYGRKDAYVDGYQAGYEDVNEDALRKAHESESVKKIQERLNEVEVKCTKMRDAIQRIQGMEVSAELIKQILKESLPGWIW